MRASLKVGLVILVASPTLSRAATWEFDSAHSKANFSVRHMMVTNVHGSFSGVSGKVEIDEKDPTRSSVEATIDATTLDTQEAKRDAHLKGPDFFDVAKFPTITFKSKKVSPAQGGYTVVGDLTMHGVTREVTLNLEPAEGEFKDPYGAIKRGGTATTRLSRKDFGITWNVPLEGGGFLVGDEVKVEIDIAIKKAAPAAKTKNVVGK